MSPSGKVLSVDGNSPASLFGFDPRVLVGCSLDEVVDVLCQPDMSVAEVLDLLVDRCGGVWACGNRPVAQRCIAVGLDLLVIRQGMHYYPCRLAAQ